MCTICKVEKKLVCFEKNEEYTRNQCKECRYAKSKQLIQKNAIKIKPTLSEKECSKCKLILSIDCYTKLIGSKDGYCSFCKACRRIKDATRKTTRLTYTPDETPFMKTCRVCKKELPHTQFRIHRGCTDGRYTTCVDCVPKSTWTKEKQKASELKYVSNNKEKIKEKWKRDGQKINRRIRNSMNKRIKEALFTTKNTTKRNHTIEYIGCSFEFFKAWITYQFIDGMSWDNYGKWHFDHVKPCKAFDLSNEDEQKQCFNWRNIQPLWGKDNHMKGGKINNDLIEAQKLKAFTFEQRFSAQVKEG